MAGIFQNLPYTNFHELNLDWVIEKVRETMAAWEDYKTSMDEWKLGVDDELAEFQAWFDNLDVQDEVRTVINELIQSGEFIEITSPQIVSATEAWLTAHITQTSPPVDNTLTISGAAADAKVTGDRITDLKEDLMDTTKLVTDTYCYPNLLDPTQFRAGYGLNTDNGNLVASEYYNAYDYIKVYGGVSYTISARRNYVLFDSNKQYLSADATESTIVSTITPSVDGYIRITFRKTAVNSFLSETNLATDFYPYGAIKYGTVFTPYEYGNILLEKSPNLINPDEILEGYTTLWDGATTVESNYKSIGVPVENGVEYTCSPVRRICFQRNDGDHTLDMTTNQPDPYTFTSPCTGMMYMNFYMNVTPVYVYKTSEANKYMPYGIDGYIYGEGIKNGNRLQGKSIYNFGDSVSAGVSQTEYNGACEYVADQNGMFCIDFAVGGSSMSYDPGQSNPAYNTNSILNKVITETSTHEEPDFVLLAGGINDLKFTTIGTFSPPTSHTDFEETYINNLDVSKFSGAFEKAIYTILTAYPSTHLIYMFEHSMNGHWDDGTEEVYTRSKEICAKWSVPFIDMRHAGGFNLAIQSQFEEFSANYPTDGTHCNEKAYKLYYVPKVTAKLLECCPYD